MSETPRRTTTATTKVLASPGNQVPGARSPGLHPMKSPGTLHASALNRTSGGSNHSLPSPSSKMGLPSPSSRAGLPSPSSRKGLPSPGVHLGSASKFPSRPAGYGQGPKFTTFDWGKPHKVQGGGSDDAASPKSTASSAQNGNNGGSPKENGSDSKGGLRLPSEDSELGVDYNDLFLRTSRGDGGSSTRATRRRLHLRHHYTEADHHQAAFARKIAPKIALALETNAEDEGYKKKAMAISHRIAHLVSLHEKDSHNTLLRLLHAFKDPKNQRLRDDTVNETIPPEIIVLLPEEKLVNPEIRREEAKERKQRTQALDETQMMKDMASITAMHTCPKCGENRAYQMTSNQTDQEKFWVSTADAVILLNCVACSHSFKV